MAINIIQQPKLYHTLFNETEYIINSTNKNVLGFRYLIQIEINSTIIQELEVAPDVYNNNYGVFDVNRILQNYIDSKITIDNNIETINNSKVNYTLRFGEVYNSTYQFESVGNFNNQVRLLGPAGVPHGYQIGDQLKLEVNSTYNDNRDLLNGYWQVVNITTNNSIILGGILWNQLGISIGNVPITSRFADNKKIRNENLINTSKIGFDVSYSNKEFYTVGSSDFEDYILPKLISNIPNNFYSTIDQYLYFNFYTFFNNMSVHFENNLGNVYSTNSLGISGNLRKIPIGPGNLPHLNFESGVDNGLIEDSVLFYDVYSVDVNDNIISNSIRIYLDRRCRINDTQLLFKDRKGSYSSYGFQLVNEINITTTKEHFYKNKIGEQSFYSEYDKNITLHTNWMTEDMSYYFEELLTSKHLKLFYDGWWQDVTLNGGGFETETLQNRNLIRKSITVKISKKQNIN